MTAVGSQYYLNDYQQLMRQFSEKQPYNAVHFIGIPSQIEHSQLEKTIVESVNQLGLGRPVFSFHETKVTFKKESGLISFPRIKATIQSHALSEINTPFPADALPLRFFLIEDGSSLFLSLTYNHWLADGASISQLLSSMLQNVTQHSANELTVSPPPKKRCFSALGLFAPLSKLALMSRNILLFSRAYRPQIDINMSLITTHLSLYIFPEDTLSKLKKISKQHGVSINDIFIALLSRMMGRLSLQARQKIKKKRFKPKRDKILISVICDIRSYSKINLKSCFNLLLGGYSLLFSSPEALPINKLLSMTHKKTHNMKKRQVPVKSTLLFDYLKKQCKKHANRFKLFHQKMPIAVGISNMNLGPSPQSELEDGRYFRFSPASAISPLVFGFTTYNQTLSLSICATSNRYKEEELPYLENQFKHELSLLFDSSPI